MRLFFVSVLTIGMVAVGCSSNNSSSKNEGEQLADSIRTVLAQQGTLINSVDSAIASYEHRLDIKMKRKTYEPESGNLVTIQKWFEFGDTTKLVKLREELLTKDKKMEVVQYHFVGDKLAQIHDYTYDKNWKNTPKQRMTEAKYYFYNDTIKIAEKREAFGHHDSPPIIERAQFEKFEPGKSFLPTQLSRLENINKKYKSLPYPKPRS